MQETHITEPEYQVQEAEYHRLLGYPRGHQPDGRARELADWARAWYAQHGRPWIYLRQAELQVTDGALILDGTPFHSPRLHRHFQQHGARRAVLLAASAGPEGEEHARELWNQAKPDEYYFLEMYASAVVEDLVARSSGRICALAGAEGMMAVPHYSPGYTGWDIADQNRLFDLMVAGMSRPFPGRLEVLSSGMLRPKKSLLAVCGLADSSGPAVARATPCASCSFAPCRYRRTPYRHAVGPVSDRTSGQSETGPTTPALEPLTRGANYSVNVRALRKWEGERVRLDRRDNGTIEARFRFDGTTCSNLGRPLAVNYRVLLSGPDEGHCIREAACTPAPDDEGWQSTCAYLADPDALMTALAVEKPLLGRPLDEVLTWTRVAAPAGCHCTADSRAHKWGLALEAIHYALSQVPDPRPVA